MNKTKKCSFKGSNIFVGIDVHKQSWKVTIRLNGLEMTTFSMDPEPEKLYSNLIGAYPDATYYSVYEAGYCGYWIHRRLEELGIHNIIVNPADVPTTNKEKDRKDDPIDSRKLCRELSNGSLKGIYIPNEEAESLRILSRCLRQYSERSTQVKNRIKGLLSFLGIICVETNKHWSRAYIEEISRHEFSKQSTGFTMNCHLEELNHIREKKLKILREIRTVSQENVTNRYLRTVCGVGTVTSFALYTEIIDMKRFSNLDHLASYIGLVPSLSKSSDKSIERGITHRHCRYLRYMLIEAAWIAVRKDPVLAMSYTALTKRMNKKRAIIKIAKKLLNRIRAVWLNQQSYEIGVVESVK